VSDTAAVELPPPPPRDAGAALIAAAGLLWPAPATVAVQRRSDPVRDGHRIAREYLLIPNAHHPRLMPPAGAPRAAAAIVRRRFGTGGRFGRLAVGAAAAAVRSGLTDRVIRDRLRITSPVDGPGDDIETVLADVLGTRVVVGLHVGTARVNRKPVLHAVDGAGHTVAFVKVGHTTAASGLVRQEAATLRELAEHSMSTVELPRVLGLTQWHGLDLLVLSPVHGRPVRSSVRTIPYAAMREVAELTGLHTDALATSEFCGRLAQLAQSLPAAETTDRYASALAALAGHDTELAFGAWHGDWQPFNMAQLKHDRFGVWDWERFSSDVPVGFDALHYALQVILHRTGIGPDAAHAFTTLADSIAVRAGAAPSAAPVVVAAYVAEVTGRYLSLLDDGDGKVLARRAHWSVGLLESAVARA
jgi:hypothetical protein